MITRADYPSQIRQSAGGGGGGGAILILSAGYLRMTEDLEDVEAVRAARAEMAAGKAAIPWEQVKADLGLS